MARARMTFEHFSRLCQGKNLTAVKVTDIHWQIKGGLRIVNVYPVTKKGPRYYIQGMSSGVTGSPLKAIEAAKKPPMQNKKHERNNWKVNKRIRERLWKLQKGLCKWCDEYVPESESTLDHIISLSHGGGNGADNLCMACVECNRKRGNSCTAEELSKGNKS